MSETRADAGPPEQPRQTAVRAPLIPAEGLKHCLLELFKTLKVVVRAPLIPAEDPEQERPRGLSLSVGGFSVYVEDDLDQYWIMSRRDGEHAIPDRIDNVAWAA